MKSLKFTFTPCVDSKRPPHPCGCTDYTVI